MADLYQDFICTFELPESMKKLLIILLYFLFALGNYAQHTKVFAVQDSIKVDSLSLRESSVEVFIGSEKLDTIFYKVDWKKSLLYFNLNQENLNGFDSLRISYKTWPIYFGKSFALRNPQFKDSSQHILWTESMAQEKEEPFFQTGGLEKSGSLLRGISLGNSQSLSLQSALNLQLSGQLADNVEIRASISDENIPIQPEGTTQRIADFDRIFIEISIAKQKIIAGDFILNKPNSYFMNYFKKGQGLQIQTRFDNTSIFKKNAPKGQMLLQASGAIARGKFARNNFNGQEGNQGPYRLSGANGEQFIVVLSGTERVFIDGKLLVRGRENDYIIDYNTAEITFTARQLITKDRRISVEFEYSERNYGRLMYQVGNEWSMGNFSYRLNFFTEQDLKNQSLQQSLSPEHILLLNSIGDKEDLAVAPSVTYVDFNPNEILYKAIDSIQSGDTIRIYKYSTHPDSARYRVYFSQVSTATGNYALEQNTANGKVYRYVGPGNGDFIAAIKLVSPKTQRMFSFGASWQLHKNFKVDAELAYSIFDKNSFSTIDNKDNGGYAYTVQFIYNKKIKNKKNKARSIDWILKYEQVEKSFTPIVRWRNVEFERDFNLGAVVGHEYIPSFSLNYYGSAHSKLHFKSTAFIKEALFLKNDVRYIYKKQGWDINLWAATLHSDGLVKTQFYRQQSDIKRDIGRHLQIQLTGETEYNSMRTDSLLSNSYMFNDWQLSIGSPDSNSKWKWKLFYRPRIDHRPMAQALHFAGLGQNMGMELKAQINKQQNLSLLFTYRDFKKGKYELLPETENSNSATGRLEYNARLLNQSIQINTFYELGSGMENKKDYSFIRVNNGQGTHYWEIGLDFNGNGVPDLDEFQEAQFVGQGNYVKILVPSLEYVKTYNTQFNQNLLLKFPANYRNGKKWQRILYKFSNQTVYRINKKTQNPALDKVLNPFSAAYGDSSIPYLHYSFRNTFYFNKNEGRYGIDIEYRDIRSKSSLTNGIDSRQDEAWQIRSRYNISRRISWFLKAEKGNKRYNSAFLRNRNYDLLVYWIENKFSYQKESKWRISASHHFSYKENENSPHALMGGELARLHNVGLEGSIHFLKQGMISLKLNTVWIDYNGQLNSNLGYEMLGGLANGLNGTWNLQIQQNIGKNLQASFIYEGRAGKEMQPGHFGSMQIRAYF